MMIGVAVFAVGESDYQSWQVARDSAARQAYQLAAPARVDAGYEANAVYLEIPLYERTGHLSRPLTSWSADQLPTFLGPDRAVFRLFFAPRGDPRPGVDYDSIAPGRIVIERIK